MGSLKCFAIIMLVTVCEVGEVQFRMLGTDSFHIKVENERFADAGLRFLQNLEFTIFQLSIMHSVCPPSLCKIWVANRVHYGQLENSEYDNFTSSFGRLRQKIASKGVPHVQHDSFSSFNQSNH